VVRNQSQMPLEFLVSHNLQQQGASAGAFASRGSARLAESIRPFGEVDLVRGGRLPNRRLLGDGALLLALPHLAQSLLHALGPRRLLHPRLPPLPHLRAARGGGRRRRRRARRRVALSPARAPDCARDLDLVPARQGSSPTHTPHRRGAAAAARGLGVGDRLRHAAARPVGAAPQDVSLAPCRASAAPQARAGCGLARGVERLGSPPQVRGALVVLLLQRALGGRRARRRGQGRRGRRGGRRGGQVCDGGGARQGLGPSAECGAQRARNPGAPLLHCQGSVRPRALSIGGSPRSTQAHPGPPRLTQAGRSCPGTSRSTSRSTTSTT